MSEGDTDGRALADDRAWQADLDAMLMGWLGAVSVDHPRTPASIDLGFWGHEEEDIVIEERTRP